MLIGANPSFRTCTSSSERHLDARNTVEEGAFVFKINFFSPFNSLNFLGHPDPDISLSSINTAEEGHLWEEPLPRRYNITLPNQNVPWYISKLRLIISKCPSLVNYHLFSVREVKIIEWRNHRCCHRKQISAACWHPDAIKRFAGKQLTKFLWKRVDTSRWGSVDHFTRVTTTPWLCQCKQLVQCYSK